MKQGKICIWKQNNKILFYYKYHEPVVIPFQNKVEGEYINRLLFYFATLSVLLSTESKRLLCKKYFLVYDKYVFSVLLYTEGIYTEKNERRKVKRR